MKARRVLTWAVAVFSASVFSSIVGFVGWVFNHSDFPPYGGGIVRLIVMPMSFVWIVILGGVYLWERIRVWNEADEITSKRRKKNSPEIPEKHEAKKI